MKDKWKVMNMYFWETTLTKDSTPWKLFVCLWPSRSNIQITFGFYAAHTKTST